MIKKLSNIGDCGIVCDFGDEVNRDINTGVIKLFNYIKKEVSAGNLNGILNYTPSYNKLIISFDLKTINSSQIMSFIKSVNFSKLNFSQSNKKFTIPICYDFEMDLENMSKTLKMNREEIINIHLNTDFFIYMVGFIPGHPFMGDLDAKLFLNRLKTPRVKIPAGSVGIVEKEVILDLDYSQDSEADVDLNVVMTSDKEFIEIQGTGERKSFSQKELEEMIKTASDGIDEILDRQMEEFS